MDYLEKSLFNAYELFEDTIQENVSNDESVWNLAKILNEEDELVGDTRQVLEDLGFRISEESELFYACLPPKGWTKKREGFWTTIKDNEGYDRIAQFVKGTLGPDDVFLRLMDYQNK